MVDTDGLLSSLPPSEEFLHPFKRYLVELGSSFESFVGHVMCVIRKTAWHEK